ncbi:hypothetical protein [Modestobacter roseus]|uniref:hypothetical protein n=1 Tax=Modestobacter roseus TaxID=1181884 RepID=UPI001295DF8D|nr:hypothetical protein [Modestobacter roseus]MQA33573.1 hypothetical protein [Modestobacter roseus]
MSVLVPRRPWWVQTLGLGLVFTAYGAFLLGTDDDLDLSLTQALLSGLLVGVVAGLAGSRGARREDARFREVTAGLSRHAARTADRASRRGPVPTDPRVRVAAVRLLDGRRAATSAQLVVGALAFTLATGCAVLLALNDTPWWWLGAVGFGAAAVAWCFEPARLRRRRARLTDDPVAA